MDALIFADRIGEELEPVNEFLTPALLPLQGEPIILHCIRSLKRIGVGRTFIIANDENLAAIRDLFSEDDFFGIQVRVIRRKKQEEYQHLVKRLVGDLNFPFLATRGDVVFKDWLTETTSTDSQSHHYHYRLYTRVEPSINRYDWDALVNDLVIRPELHSDIIPMLNLREYHRILSLSLSKNSDKVRNHGKLISDNLVVARGAVFSFSNFAKGCFYIGEQSSLSPHATLEGNCYIGNHCVIDKKATVKNSVVLDYTYIGVNQTINDAIVIGDRVININDNTATYKKNLIQTKRPESVRHGLLNRLMALAIIPFISLLLLCWLTFALLTKRKLTRAIRDPIQENISSLEKLFLYNSKFLLIRNFPVLLQVARGTLPFFGRALITKAGQDSIETLSREYLQIRPGFLSFSQCLQRQVEAESLDHFREFEYRALFKANKHFTMSYFFGALLQKFNFI